MKSLLLCLALMLVPTGLMACPGGGPCGCPGGEVVLNPVDQQVADVLDLMYRIADNAAKTADRLGFETSQLLASVEGEKAAAEEFQKGALLFQSAMKDMAEGAKSASLATSEDGPVAASLRLSAASKFASATGKLINCCEHLDEAMCRLEAMEDVDNLET